MAITYPRDFPTINGQTIIEKMTIRQKNAVVLQESPFAYKQQVYDFGGRRWEAEVTIRPLTHDEALVFQGFLASLQGQRNTFLMGSPLWKSDNENNAVEVDVQTLAGDDTLQIRVATLREVKAGQFFEIDQQLYMFLEDQGTTDGATKKITPPTRKEYGAGEDCITNLPVGTWRLATNDVDWDISKAGLYSFSFSCVEAL